MRTTLTHSSHQSAHLHGHEPPNEAEAEDWRGCHLRSRFSRRHCKQYVLSPRYVAIQVANFPVIRAYYSKRNETMLTCTVSMIETAVAIIATCLPRMLPSHILQHHKLTLAPSALRTVILGHSSTAGNNSGYRHYELSSAGHHRSHRAGQSRITTNIIGGTQNKGNDSEDELVTEPGHLAVPSGSSSVAEDKSTGIVVSTTFEVQSGMHRDSSVGYHARS